MASYLSKSFFAQRAGIELLKMLAFSSSISVVVTNLPSSVLSNVLSELLMTSINLLNLASSYSKTEFIDSSYLNGYFYSISFVLNGSLICFRMSWVIVRHICSL